MLSLKDLVQHVVNWIKDMNQVQTLTPTWNTGTAGTANLRKWGKVVELRINNPTALAVGQNDIFTLPVGWRPASNHVLMLIAPVGSISAGGTQLALRATIRPNGNVEIYNYRSTAISGNSNASATITYIVN